MDLKAVVDAMQVLKSVNVDDLTKALTDADLSTAVDKSLDKSATHLTTSEHVVDRWENGMMWTLAPKRDFVVGPPEEASGGGAERMIRHYSHPAPQNPLVTMPEQLSGYLGDLQTALKAQQSALKEQGSVLAQLMTGFNTVKSAVVTLVEAKTAETAKAAAKPTTIAKAEDESEEDEEDDESEVVEINASKGKSLLAKAKSILRTIKAKKAEMEEEEDEEEKCKAKAEIKALKRKAKSLFGKARMHLYAAKGAGFADADSLLASLVKSAAKADIDVVQEEEEDDDEEEEADKAKAKAAATTDTSTTKSDSKDKGNQADRQNPENGNQDDSAKALSAMAAKIDDALSGVGMLKASVNDMFNVVSGKSKITDLVVPDISKAVQAVTPEVLYQRIEAAENSGQLTPNEAFAAQEIVQRLDESSNLNLDQSIVGARLQKTTPNVRAFFQQATHPQGVAA